MRHFVKWTPRLNWISALPEYHKDLKITPKIFFLNYTLFIITRLEMVRISRLREIAMIPSRRETKESSTKLVLSLYGTKAL